MVSSFHDHDVSAKVWTQQQAQRFDDIRSFGFSPGDTQHSELFLRQQHDEVRTKIHSVKGKEKKNNIVVFELMCNKID